MKILVTGAAGFIGHHVATSLLARGDEVLGIDSLNDYYDPALKLARIERLRAHDRFAFEKMDLSDRSAVGVLRDRGIDRIVHLAAQAGVRHSIEQPFDYLDANLAATLVILELARAIETSHLVFASSSSVYGLNEVMPFATEHPVDHPLSLYAATKRSGELMAHGYARLYGIPTTGLRFFSVYGTWGRPDMALWKFADAIREGRPIELYNHGRHRRDFTWIDDVVDGLLRVLDQPAAPDPEFDPANPRLDRSDAPFRLYNLGNDTNVDLLRFVGLIEEAMGRKAETILLPKQPGDVEASAADVGPMRREFGWEPTTPVDLYRLVAEVGRTSLSDIAFLIPVWRTQSLADDCGRRDTASRSSRFLPHSGHRSRNGGWSRYPHPVHLGKVRPPAGGIDRSRLIDSRTPQIAMMPNIPGSISSAAPVGPPRVTSGTTATTAMGTKSRGQSAFHHPRINRIDCCTGFARGCLREVPRGPRPRCHASLVRLVSDRDWRVVIPRSRIVRVPPTGGSRLLAPISCQKP